LGWVRLVLHKFKAVVMVAVAISEEIKTLGQVQDKLGISLTEDARFFEEWMGVSGSVGEADRSRLDQVRRNFLYQSSDGVLLEETIKMIILSPLLELAGFYQAPFRFRAEVSVAVEAIGEKDEVLRGRIDGLVLQERLWVVLIEAKRTTFDLELALPQTLSYMAAAPERDPAFATLRDRPVFGMVTNGASYLFVKLMGAEYGVSDLFGTRSPHRNNLVEVLEILRCFGRLVTM
jgi:hypothetical protein